MGMADIGHGEDEGGLITHSHQRMGLTGLDSGSNSPQEHLGAIACVRVDHLIPLHLRHRFLHILFYVLRWYCSDVDIKHPSFW